MSKRIIQQSKMEKENKFLNSLISKYQNVDFDIVTIRKELRISDSIFDNKNPMEAKFRLNHALHCRGVRFENFQKESPNFSKWLNEPKTYDEALNEKLLFRTAEYQFCTHEEIA